MQKTVIIVAGGKGERMNADIPKQFIEIEGKPILMHTIEVFYSYDSTIGIVLVLPSVQIDFWKSLCKKHDFTLLHQISEGGQTRFHSVKNGLSAVTLPSLIAVHDGVRPLVSHETIERCFEQAALHKAIVPVTDMIDSIRYADSEKNYSCDRNLYKLVQTPQVFEGELLKRAYEQDFSSEFTDDASVVEKSGVKIHLVEGNRENIKITTSFDLKVAACLLKQ